MALLHILVDLGLLDLIEPRQLCVCSSVLGPSWLSLWLMKGMQRGLTVRQAVKKVCLGKKLPIDRFRLLSLGDSYRTAATRSV